MNNHIKMFEEWHDHIAYLEIKLNKFQSYKNELENLKDSITYEDNNISKNADKMEILTIKNVLEVVIDKIDELQTSYNKYISMYNSNNNDELNDVLRTFQNTVKYIESLLSDAYKIMKSSLDENFITNSINKIKHFINTIKLTYQKLDKLSNDINNIIKNMEAGKKDLR